MLFPKRLSRERFPNTSNTARLTTLQHPKLGLIDYGMGNLHSVRKAFERFGYSIVDIHQPEDLETLDALVLPGVGSFDPAMDNLMATGLIPDLKDWVKNGRPLLGICLGLQLLFENSEEGERDGLGLLPGRIEKLPAQHGERLPHMGWAPLKVVHNSPLLHHDDPEAWVYFVHSYAAHPSDSETLAATTSYGNVDITAMVWRGNVGACQFHPEKSSDAGALLLKRWLNWLGHTTNPD